MKIFLIKVILILIYSLWLRARQV